MTGARLDIQWSPVHSNKFITWGTEIYLYETLPSNSAPKADCVPISNVAVAHLLATIANHHYVKCVDIYPQPGPDILLAVGQANGKVALSSFGPSAYDALGLTGLELAPKHARQCNSVAWNPSQPSLIAAGLDKYRTDHSVLLWDIMKRDVAAPTHGTLAELGLSDTAHSLAWLPHQPRTLVIGINNKHLKLVDLRDPSKASNSAPTKAVYGLAVAPHSDYQLASYFENQIAIWDIRGFEKPVLTLPQAKVITKIIWCPTRHNLLGSLQKDSSVIHLHDVQQAIDEVDPSVLERSVQPVKLEDTITSFSWHPTHDNRLITMSSTGAFTDYTVCERMTVNWARGSHLVWTFGRRTLKMISDKDPVYGSIEDTAMMMKKRAILGYGLKDEIWQNGDLVHDQNLKNIWHCLHSCRNLVQDSYIDPIGATKFPGIRSILGLDTSSTITTKSEVALLHWADSSQTTAKIYRSEDRERALHLCGWRFDHELSAFSIFLERLEAEGSLCRAAAIAVFNLRLRHAIEILTRGTTNTDTTDNLSIVAMALSGYTDSKNSMWRELCMSSRAQLSHPYLRAMFAFLTAENDSYDGVLNETGMAVEDRVAFACTFLPNNKLAEYLVGLTESLVGAGDLGGVLLTGAGPETLPLLQNYLDNTGDLQTVSLVAVRALPTHLLETDSRAQDWVNSYRDLLNSWRMWNHRARVDIALSARNPSTRPLQQVYVSCNFCGKSVSAYVQANALSRGQLARLGTSSNKLKMTSCPNCRKPQPRCAICLVNMGTSASHDSAPARTTSPPRSPPSPHPRLTEFGSWYSWCQTCRHGGHAMHMTQWFREHTECPVTACNCRCLSLDSSSKISSLAVG